MRYFFVVGEPSGDLHASNLMRGILDNDSEASFRFYGGDKMASIAGPENLVKHYKKMSFFGVAEVIRNIRTILSQIKQCQKAIMDFNPDVVVLVDYPSFNMEIARFAHNHGFTVYYYIAPKVWAWKEWRVKLIKKYVDRLYTIFPFETNYFRKKGIEAHFFGNPLQDAIHQRLFPMKDTLELRKELGVDNRPIIALLAGSRRTEIRRNLRNMLLLRKRFPNYQMVLTAVSWIPMEFYQNIIKEEDIHIVVDKTYEVLSISQAAIVTSGTATLETALIGTPEVVVYHVSRIVEFMRPFVLKIPFISLVNINLGKECVKEIVTSRFNCNFVETQLRSILPGGEKREKMLADFEQLRQLIKEKGSSFRTAADMVESLKKKS
ncbi:MAG: lipid-A-disaccharide synthase [Alistipes sp.]|nr:lipid-A-disaccharide synthase [Candidatus Alistipes equi]